MGSSEHVTAHDPVRHDRRSRARTATGQIGASPLSPATTVVAVWLTWLGVCAATWATNARTPLRLLYAVDTAGIRAGASRVVVLLGWPVALLAIALTALAADRLLATEPAPRVRRAVVGTALLALLLCATVFAPGVFDPKHLDAKPVNAPAAVGVGVAFVLSVWSLVTVRSTRTRADVRSPHRKLLILLAVALLFAAIPWLFANAGFYVGDVPGLRVLFMSKQVVPEPGHPLLRAVHLGNHDGLDGLVLAIACAALLSCCVRDMQRLRRVTSAYLSLLIAYGLAVAAADWWLEQVVKRGWASRRIPSPMYPSAGLPWAIILLAAAVIFSIRRRRVPA